MNSFFESDIVVNELAEIEELKKQMLQASLKIMTEATTTEEDKDAYFDLLNTLVDKQQIFLNRIYFSQDKEAMKVKEFYEKMLSAANKETGKSLSLNEYFNEAKKSIEQLKEAL